MIGSFGKEIIFEVSDKTALTFRDLSRTVSGRWADHEASGAKPRSEFLGPGLQEVTFTVHLSAGLGVKPREVIRAVERMVEAGDAEYLVIGSSPVSTNPFRVTESSEAWNAVYHRGELVKADISLTLSEYV